MTNSFKLSITPLEDRTCLSTTGTSVGVPLPPPPPPVTTPPVIVKLPDIGMGNIIRVTAV